MREAMSSVALAVCPASAFTSPGDDREAAAGLAGAGGLDRGVEGQKIGLAGNRLDRRENGVDALGGIGQGFHAALQDLARFLDLVHRIAGHLGRFGTLGGPGRRLADRFGHGCGMIGAVVDRLGRGVVGIGVSVHRGNVPDCWLPQP